MSKTARTLQALSIANKAPGAESGTRPADQTCSEAGQDQGTGTMPNAYRTLLTGFSYPKATRRFGPIPEQAQLRVRLACTRTEGQASFRLRSRL